MSSVFKYSLNMIPYMFTSLPIILLCRAPFIVAKKKNKNNINFYHEIGTITFFMICIGIASQTIIPKIEFGVSSGILNENLLGEINLIPGKVFLDTYFECIRNEYWPYFLINFVGNICLFIPIGFLIPILWENISNKKIITISILSSMFIELCQLPQARGTDIDDIWINLLGALLGYGIYFLLDRNNSIHCLFLKFRY